MNTITLLERLSALYPDSSKRTLRSWILHKTIHVNGSLEVRPSTLVANDSTIERKKVEKMLTGGGKILFEDQELIIIDKPHGLLSVKLDKKDAPSLHANIKTYTADTVYPIHRLDKSTSGVIAYAKTKAMQQKMKGLWMQKKVARTYTAIVPSNPCHPAKGTISIPLRETKALHVVACTKEHPDAMHAVSHYTLLRKNPKYSTYTFTLETGKKHQIRVHASHALSPIVGDTRYGSIDDPIERVCLHSKTLQFIHPTTLVAITIEAELPHNMKKISYQ